MSGSTSGAAETRDLGRIYDEDEDDEDLEDEEFDDEDDDDESDADDDPPEDDDDGELEEFDGDDEDDDEETEPVAPERNGSARARATADSPAPDPEENSSTAARSTRRREQRAGTRMRGAGGMGRPSTGPRVRAAAAPSSPPRSAVSRSKTAAAEVLTIDAEETELAPDISTWPGTAEAARIVGRHTSTIKIWRNQGRIRAQRDSSDCWRYHPDDLAEAVETPDQTDPGSVLASGMAAIVQNGSAANERLLAMTELTTDGLKEACVLLREELKAAYARIRELEVERTTMLDKLAVTHAEDRKHDRQRLRMEQKHELELAGTKENSARLSGLLTILGPIAASIGSRLLGDIVSAETLEKAVAQGTSQATTTPSTVTADAVTRTPPAGADPLTPVSSESRLVPIETRITDAMGRLCDAIRKLDRPQFAGLRAMLPAKVAEALDAIVQAESDGTVGQALAVIVQAAQNLSDLQFAALRPIAPLDIATILGELRVMLREQG